MVKVEQGILVHIPCMDCSYKIVLDILQRYTKYKLIPVLRSTGLLNISDTVFFYSSFHFLDDLNDIIWVDTKFSAKNIKIKKDFFPDAKVYVTSKWNKELVESVGGHVDDIVPRVVDIHIASKFTASSGGMEVSLTKTKKYDFIVIANTDKSVDHKNVLLTHKLLVNMNLRRHAVIVSNLDVADMKVFSLSEDDKYKLLAESRFYLALSGSEGFGLPPVEAMAVGTIPIYLDAHAYAEWLKGFPVSYECKKEVVVDGLFMDYYKPDVKDVERVIRSVLTMTNTDYEIISEEVRKYAMDTFSVEPILGKIFKPKLIF